MSPDFIFMLTRADRTIEDAEARLPEVLAAGVRHVGFKDIGLPPRALARLAKTIREAGATTYLEVVSSGSTSEAASARMAVELGVDVLMGGVHPEIVTAIISGVAMRYLPYPGDVVGHPCVLAGTVESTVKSALRLLDMPGVDGLDLLAYRFEGDAEALMAAVGEAAAGRPLVIAGSLDRAERLEAVSRSRATAFTVGTAALDGAFPCVKTLGQQIDFIFSVSNQRGLEGAA